MVRRAGFEPASPAAPSRDLDSNRFFPDAFGVASELKVRPASGASANSATGVYFISACPRVAVGRGESAAASNETLR